ncbi:hypothetical protein MLP_37100 [Microlunatus phosphovorus NM-1]|uniref:Uncharacterized protein n=1 Tax=Microlunatus phosphovorus (strain ATCC 700054 / DSM 10555 / JCM 9379 / NBRC 101784 / NCIMB 13414 / VKM Ac-1990 / NM-1) TaxID=1032480 RepID=F5XP84_MICPN|nr:hypothetical protein MLP_37100 [Microlunatus phosphovorus NM-1]
MRLVPSPSPGGAGPGRGGRWRPRSQRPCRPHQPPRYSHDVNPESPEAVLMTVRSLRRPRCHLCDTLAVT